MKAPYTDRQAKPTACWFKATVGCPHNKCTFCMVYKKGPRFRVRPVPDILEDLDEAKKPV